MPLIEFYSRQQKVVSERSQYSVKLLEVFTLRRIFITTFDLILVKHVVTLVPAQSVYVAAPLVVLVLGDLVQSAVPLSSFLDSLPVS